MMFLQKYLGEKYPESYDGSSAVEDLVYSGNVKFDG